MTTVQQPWILRQQHLRPRLSAQPGYVYDYRRAEPGPGHVLYRRLASTHKWHF